jgi:hypothetical protein
MFETVIEYTLSGWPNCSVPDCEWKANLPHLTCYAHTHGLPVRPFDQYEDLTP